MLGPCWRIPRDAIRRQVGEDMENHRLDIGGRSEETLRRFTWQYIFPALKVSNDFLIWENISQTATTRSWSPDGAHITASNATNNKGFVFIAAVITRNTWTSEISLVGHENTVEVAVSSFTTRF
jgi:hypothetical protein